MPVCDHVFFFVYLCTCKSIEPYQPYHKIYGNSSPDSIWQSLQATFLQSRSNLVPLRQLLFEMAPGDP